MSKLHGALDRGTCRSFSMLNWASYLEDIIWGTQPYLCSHLKIIAQRSLDHGAPSCQHYPDWIWDCFVLLRALFQAISRHCIIRGSQLIFISSITLCCYILISDGCTCLITHIIAEPLWFLQIGQNPYPLQLLAFSASKLEQSYRSPQHILALSRPHCRILALIALSQLSYLIITSIALFCLLSSHFITSSRLLLAHYWPVLLMILLDRFYGFDAFI